MKGKQSEPVWNTDPRTVATVFTSGCVLYYRRNPEASDAEMANALKWSVDNAASNYTI